MDLQGKLAAVAAVVIIGVSGVAIATTHSAKNKTYELERAVRLQTLTNMALNNGNYDLACKAQHEVTDSIIRADIIDVIEQADVVESEICSWAWTSSIASK